MAVRALGEGGAVWGAAGGAAQLACEARYEPAPAPELRPALPPLRIRWTHEGETLDPQVPSCPYDFVFLSSILILIRWKIMLIIRTYFLFSDI